MRRRHVMMMVLGVVLLAAPAFAQTPEAFTVSFYDQGASAPRSSHTFTASEAVCDQPALSSTSAVNPTTLVWDDPQRAGRTCRWSDQGSGPIFALPVGFSYEATLRASNVAGSSGESNRAPFSRLGVPAAPANFRVRSAH